jgi:hypothetical protein
MSNKSFLLPLGVPLVIALAGCDPNPTGPSAPSAPSASATASTDSEQAPQIKKKKGRLNRRNKQVELLKPKQFEPMADPD